MCTVPLTCVYSTVILFIVRMCYSDKNIDTYTCILHTRTLMNIIRVCALVNNELVCVPISGFGCYMLLPLFGCALSDLCSHSGSTIQSVDDAEHR